MTGTQRQVLRIVKQLREADLKTIASTMGVSIDYVKDLCQGLIHDNLLRQGPDGEYMVTKKGSRIQITGGGEVGRYRGGGDAVTKRFGVPGKEKIEEDMKGDAKRYPIGEVVGEIKMEAHLPSPEQVEVALRSNPQSSYEEMEDGMTSHTLVCPAKGKEVSWHYCSTCPHQEEIDFQRWTVQCSYEFNERRLSMVYGKKEIEALAGKNKGEFTDLDIEEHVALPHVECPLLGRVIAVDRCTACRYQRGGQWNPKSPKRGVVGWVLCSAPPTIERRSDDGRKVKEGEKEWRAVPPRWR